jgi:hypothetical protein
MTNNATGGSGTKMRKVKVVRVDWIDIQAHGSEWQDWADVAKMTTAKCVTIGLLAYEDENLVKVVGSVVEGAQVGDVTCIPQGCISEMHVLEEISVDLPNPKRKRKPKTQEVTE